MQFENQTSINPLSPTLPRADEISRRSSAPVCEPARSGYLIAGSPIRPGLQPAGSVAGERIAGDSDAPRLSSQGTRWWRSIGTATSWVIAQLIEGLAAYGQAMYPSVLEPLDTDATHHGGPAERRQFGRCTLAPRQAPPASRGLGSFVGEARGRGAVTQLHRHQYIAGHVVTSPNVAPAETTALRWNEWATSPLAKLGSAIRHERQRRRSMREFEVLSDRELKDIGIWRR